jgi:tRNA(fMet)-specific endonuclease VapC
MVMPWLLDTNAWIDHLKNPGGPVEQRLNRVLPADVLLCSIVKAELWHGADKYERRQRRLAALDNLFHPFTSLPFDDHAAKHYATVRHDLEVRGHTIGPNDLKIAAICLTHGLTLVSANLDEFRRVSGLSVEDWTKP